MLLLLLFLLLKYYPEKQNVEWLFLEQKSKNVEISPYLGKYSLIDVTKKVISQICLNKREILSVPK